MKSMCFALVAGWIALSAARLDAEVVCDAAAEFDLMDNGASQWGYGYRDSHDSTAFTPLAENGDYPYLAAPGDWFKGWYESDTVPPHIFQNVSVSDQGFSTIPSIAPGQLVLHPGEGSMSHVVMRWTVPSAGEVRINSIFTRLDESASESSDVYLVHNGDVLREETLTGLGDLASFPVKTPLAVATGDFIDFVVGPAGDFLADSTALDAQIEFSAVPEPSALATMCLGLLTVALIARSRRRSSAT
jgi:hypothetical protein